MGIMIHDEEIISTLTRLADRDGVTKAEALKRALLAMLESADHGNAKLFPRERVTSKTWTIGSPIKKVAR